jgi:hypothetical protein
LEPKNQTLAHHAYPRSNPEDELSFNLPGKANKGGLINNDRIVINRILSGMDLFVVAVLVLLLTLFIIGSLLGKRRRALNANMRQLEARMQGEAEQRSKRFF